MNAKRIRWKRSRRILFMLILLFLLNSYTKLKLKMYQIWDGFCAVAKPNGGRRSSAALTGIAPNAVRLRASNPWIAARNPRFHFVDKRGAFEATPWRKRRPKMI